MIITAYCDTDPKECRLDTLCRQVRPAADFLVVASHTPIPGYVQEHCDYAIYDRNNAVDERKYSHGCAESMLIEQAMNALDYYGVSWTYKLPFDCDVGDTSIFADWASKGRPFVSCRWGELPIGTFAFYTNVQWFRSTFTAYHSVDEMFRVSNLLEVCWWKDLERLRRVNDVYLYEDLRRDMFKVPEGRNRADLFFKTY